MNGVSHFTFIFNRNLYDQGLLVLETKIHKSIYTHLYSLKNLQLPNSGNNLDVKWIWVSKGVVVCLPSRIIPWEEKWNIAFCYNIKWTCRSYVKWNKVEVEINTG